MTETITQRKCPMCGEYRRSYLGRHGIIHHCFFDHAMCGEDIRMALLNLQPSVTVMGVSTLPPDWWDRYVMGEPE